MSCSAWVPWQYAPPIGHPHAVGLGPIFPPAKLQPPDEPQPKPREPAPGTQPDPAAPPAQGTDTARPDVGAIAMWLGAGFILASVLMGAKGMAVGGMGAM